MKFNSTFNIGLILIILGLLSVGYMSYLIHYGLITLYSLIICVLMFCISVISGFAICTRKKDKDIDNTKNREDEKHNESYSLISTVFCCLVCFVLAFSLLYLGDILDDKPDKIIYGGGGHSMGSSDSEIVLYQDENGWNMIIPDNYGEPDVNYTLYHSYHWNGTTWVFEEEE